jgi:multidrug resistance efflux pump
MRTYLQCLMFSMLWLAAGACAERGAAEQETLTLRSGTLHRQHLLTGEVEAEDAVEILTPDAPIQPLEIRWLAEDGSAVAAGATLVEFENSSLLTELDAKKTGLLEAENRLISAQAEAVGDGAQAEFALEEKRVALEKARLKADVPEDLLTGLEFQERQLELRRSELAFAEAEKDLATRRAKNLKELEIRRIEVRKVGSALEQLLAGIQGFVLTAPQDGIFQIYRSSREDRKWQVGDTVWIGETVARLPDLSSLIIRARLFDVDDGNIAPGAPATVAFDAFPEKRISARVRTIESLAQQAEKGSVRRFFNVVVDLEEVDAAWMRPGMSARVEVEADLPQALLAPRRSLDLADLQAPRLLLADGRRLEVTLEACDADFCAVSGALEEGMALADRESSG